MGEMLDIMGQTTISGRSPDKSITITVSGMPADIKVDIAPGTHARHTEESLEQQVNAAIRVAMVAYQQAAMRAWRGARRVPQPATEPPAPDPDRWGRPRPPRQNPPYGEKDL